MNQPAVELTLAQVIGLGADDPMFYCHHWFPHVCRQDSPAFHVEMWDALTDPNERFVSFEIFRGGAKTTQLRLFASYVVSYGISRTIVVVGKSQDHARKSVEWLMSEVEQNYAWAQAFGLSPGNKWTGEEIEIRCAEGHTVRVLALGITGSTRGINVKSYRPDLIIVDDPCDEENTATPEQRKKISDLFFGALAKSLAPKSEAPLSKMCLAQTPFNEADLIHLTILDPQWKSFVFGCFDEHGQSRWPARWTTEELMADKAAHIERNMLSLWLREMECVITSDETAAFPEGWLQYHDVPPKDGYTWLAMDPVPPPREQVEGPNKKRTDYFTIGVLRAVNGKVHILETWGKQQPDESEWLSKVFEFHINYGAKLIKLETILFARMVRTALEKEMQRRRLWLTIEPVEDQRKKDTRIRQEISPYASNRMISVARSEVAFIEQWRRYPDVNHDDYLDMLAIGLIGMEYWIGQDYIEGDFESLGEEPLPDTWKAVI